MTATEIAAYVEQTYGVKFTSKGITKLLHRLGFSSRLPKQVSGKANAELQKAFLEQYQEFKETKKPEDSIYFVDGVHPLHDS